MVLLQLFFDNLLQVSPKISLKMKSIKTLENGSKDCWVFTTDDFSFNLRSKSSIFKNLEEKWRIISEKLADELLTAIWRPWLTFIDQVKETVPEPIKFERSTPEKEVRESKLSSLME